MTTPFLLYGSYGYTGALIAELAVRRGMNPILSGRDAVCLQAQAELLGFEYRPISLDDPKALEAALEEVPMVLNCAGPFQHTYKPIVDACLRTGRHYVDITGEIGVFESLAAQDTEARKAGIMLLPGMGFDVVPSDCLAAHLKRRLPEATHLTLAIGGLRSGISRGTLLTSLEGLPGKGVVRKEGKIVQVPLLWKTRQIDFGRGPRTAANFPWGDVSTAYYSTGINNIETYMVLPRSVMRLAPILRQISGLFSLKIIQGFLQRQVMKMPPGPSVEKRRQASVRLWGEARDDTGRRAVSRLETPDGYDLTAETALRGAERVLAGDFKPGFQTPSLAYGADFIIEFEGVSREDI
jgi:short subunit dehydrogenase-like uncharacterized protein